MKNLRRVHWAMSEIAEQEAPASRIDLWSSLRAQMPLQTKAHSSRLSVGNRIKGFAFGSMFLLLLIGVMACVPEVRAFATDVIQRMGIAFVNTKQLDETVEIVRVEATKVTPPPSLSLEEVRQRLPFSLGIPSWLPDGLTYMHVSISEYDPNTLEGSGQQVSITYGRTADFDFESGVLFFRANDGPIGAPPLLAESRQQKVTVNGQPGVYVHGGWRDDGGGDPSTKMGNLQWDDQSDDAYLTWIQDGVTYLLEAHNLGLNLSDLLRIAVSLETE
jgi:hypothetical protein